MRGREGRGMGSEGRGMGREGGGKREGKGKGRENGRVRVPRLLRFPPDLGVLE